MAITAAIIRTKLLDTASKNTFLGEEEFSTPEITTAITEALSYWNATQPLVADLEYASADAIPSAYDEPFSCRTSPVCLFGTGNPWPWRGWG